MQKQLTTTSPTRKSWVFKGWAFYLQFFRLKKQYRAANEHIGKTGAGLKPEDVTPRSELANLIGS